MRPLILMLLMWPMLLLANGDCENPHHQCGHTDAGPPGPEGPPGPQGPPGKDGQDGQDGADGTNGVDGQDGRDGVDGIDGIDGINGVDGVVPDDWITTTNNTFNIHNKWIQSYRDVAAAEAAMQIYLPQDQTSRLTIGMSRVNSTSGYALGYAYMIDNERNTALTFAVGVAGDETAAKASLGFEFGGRRHIKLDTMVSPNYTPVVLEPEGEDYVTETQLEVADELIMLNVEGAVAQVDGRVDGLEDRLDANAAAALAEEKEREEWKVELTETYLTTEN